MIKNSYNKFSVKQINSIDWRIRLSAVFAEPFKSTTIITVVLLLGFSVNIFSQELIPLHADYTVAIDKALLENKISNSSFLKPYLRSSMNTSVNTDSILSFSIARPKIKKGWIVRKWRYESLVEVDSSDFKINIDPLFDFGYGRNKENTNKIASNSRGARVWGSLGNELYFETTFIESQSKFLPYLTDYANSAVTIPGQGRSRNFGANGFDYSIASGLLSFGFKKHFQLVAGNGKLFAGDGYRSLLLSDNAYNYPYIRLSANYKKWSFTKILALTLCDTLPQTNYGVREKRLAGFNIVSFIPNHYFQITIFEGNIFRYPNDRKNINFNYLFLNPVIGVNSFLQDGNFSSVLGIGSKTSLLNHFEIYNQLVISNLQNDIAVKDKFGFQIGIKYYNALLIRNLYLQVEYNRVAKQTYITADSLLNYTHHNQPIAHPFGNNFSETVCVAQYNLKCWQLNVRWVNGVYGVEGLAALKKKARFVTAVQYETPFISYGPRTNTEYLTLSVSYLLNSLSNRKIEAGYVMRDASLAGTAYFSDYFYISFKTVLDNWYYDF